MDRNSQDPSKRKSFFDEDSSNDEVHNPPPPHPEQRVYNDRERMTTRYREEPEDEYEEDEYDRRKPARFGFMSSLGKGNGDGSSTKKLTYAAAGIGGLLVVFIGGWMLYSSTNKGIPVFEPPAEVAKVKPANAGNPSTIGMGLGDNALNNGGQANGPVAAGPEKANPQGLADQFNNPPPPVDAPPPVSPANNGSATPAIPSAPLAPAPEENTPEEAPAPKPVAHPKHQQQRPQPHHATTPKKAEPKKADKKSESHKATASGNFGIQLASLKSHDAALKQWQIIKKKAPDVLGRYSPSIQKAEVNGNAVYRLRIRGLASKAQVNSVCGQLKAKGVACTMAY